MIKGEDGPSAVFEEYMTYASLKYAGMKSRCGFCMPVNTNIFCCILAG